MALCVKKYLKNIKKKLAFGAVQVILLGTRLYITYAETQNYNTPLVNLKNNSVKTAGRYVSLNYTDS